MQSLAKLLGYAVMAVAVFYVVMFFFAESIPLPYHMRSRTLSRLNG